MKKRGKAAKLDSGGKNIEKCVVKSKNIENVSRHTTYMWASTLPVYEISSNRKEYRPHTRSDCYCPYKSLAQRISLTVIELGHYRFDKPLKF